MTKANFRRPSRAQSRERAARAAVPDEAIDTCDIPEVLDWAGAERGLFYRPAKDDTSPVT